MISKLSLLVLVTLLARGASAAERAAVVPVIPSAVAVPVAPTGGAWTAPAPLSFSVPSTNLSLPAALTLPAAAVPGAGAQAEGSRAATISAGARAETTAGAAAKIVAAPGVSAVTVPAQKPGAAKGDRSVTTALSETLTPAQDASASAAPLATRLDAAFDGSISRQSLNAGVPVAGSESQASAPLGRSVAATATQPSAVPAPKAGVRRSARILTAIIAALLLLSPSIALAAVPGGPATAATSLSWLAAIHPIASAAGAVVGAIYGLFAARPKDGSEASAGDVLTSALRYGVIGGASVYALMDLTQMVFIGPGVGLKPLSSAVATAALGRAAFQAKFSDAATTSADRIIGAFPAVAAALGLSIGVNLLPPALSYQLAMTAMAATGVLTAVYAAIFKVGRSPADGPSLMAKGFVLQTLMWGLALALTTPWQVWSFTVMGAAGLGLILWAFGRELWSLRPSARAPKSQ